MTDIIIPAIVGGHVFIEDGVKKAEDYAPARKVHVHLSFDGGKEMLDHASILAHNTVSRLLTYKAGDALPAEAAPATEAAPKATKAKAAPKTEPKPAETPPADDVTDEIAALDDLNDDGRAFQEPQDDLDALFGGAPAPAEITDATLNDEVQKKHREINNPPAIRALLAEFNPDKTKVGQLRDIPQDQRQPFLDKLKALKKA